MSLQVWLPLNGDSHNQGLNGVDPTVMGTGITYSAGKIGKAAVFPNNCNSCIHMAGLRLQTGSFIAWIKVNGTGATSRQCIISEGRDSYTDGVELYATQAGTTLSFKAHEKVISTTIELNKWYHVAGTFGNNIVSLYVNGVLIGTQAYTTDMTYTYASDLTLGKMSYSYSSTISYFSFNGALNDVRIYDHCLSESEVKELARGLVLHYPLNRNGWGQENIIANSQVNGSWGYSSSGYDHYAPTTLIVPSASQYTLSFDAKSTVAGDKLRTHYYSPNTTTTCVSNQGTTKTASDGNMDFILTTNWRRYWVTYTQTETTAVKHVICPRLMTSMGGTGTVSVRNVKFEEGAKATPWSPASSDALATTLNINGNIEYDISGYCHNGTKNNITYTSDTPKYGASSTFNGTNSYIKVDDNSWMVQGATEFTVNFWAKATTWPTNGGRLVSCTETGGFNLEAGNSGYWRFPIHVYTAADLSSVAYKYDSKEIQISALTANAWNMITLVYNSIGTKTYINGQLHHTYTNTSYGIHFNTNARLFLGCEASTASPSTPYFSGQMNDFRFYYTALSADDIAELYAQHK